MTYEKKSKGIIVKYSVKKTLKLLFTKEEKQQKNIRLQNTNRQIYI